MAENCMNCTTAYSTASPSPVELGPKRWCTPESSKIPLPAATSIFQLKAKIQGAGFFPPLPQTHLLQAAAIKCWYFMDSSIVVWEP